MLNLSSLKFCLVAACVLGIFSQTAQATLTSYTSNGKDLVYSSISDVTWTKDANLLKTMIDKNGYDAVINAIITASPTVSSLASSMYAPTGSYNLSQNDFDGEYVTWYGAVGFVNYLNTINYAGSSLWRLPTILDFNQTGCSVNEGATPTASVCYLKYTMNNHSTEVGNELAELYFHELGGIVKHSDGGPFTPITHMPQTDIFENEDDNPAFVTGSENPSNGNSVYYFDTFRGMQLNYLKGDLVYYAWAITPGSIAAVPEPRTRGVLIAGICLIGGIRLLRKLNA